MSAGNERGALPLVIHTKLAEVSEFQPSASSAIDRSQNDRKTAGGLVRVKFAPRGVNVEDLEKSDLAVYRRFLRWQRLRGVQHLFGERYYFNEKGERNKIYVERVSKCYRVRISPVVKVMRSAKVQRAHYGGLIVCGGVWVCPICSAKITERRRQELEGANDKGLSKFMVTYTLQHDRNDELCRLDHWEKKKITRGKKKGKIKDVKIERGLLPDLLAGIKDMKATWGYKKLLERLHIAGSVTALEITISNVNGWHPHLHALMFSTLKQNEIKADEIRSELSALFVASMSKRGRYVHDQIGVNVKSGKEIKSEYLAKFGEADTKQSTWSLAAEITKSPVKSGRDDDHFHPFELLDMYLSKNINAGRKFIEYAVAMKGKKQLHYTKGLKKLLGLDDVELSDQEVAEMEVDKSAVMFAEIQPEEWTIILRHEKRGQLLEVASRGNYNEFVMWMRVIGCENFGKEQKA